MDKNIQIIIDYVEGRMNANEFKKIFFENIELQKFLKKKLNPKHIYYQQFDLELYQLFKNGYDYQQNDWDTIGRRFSLQKDLQMFLDDYLIQYKIFSKYDEDFNYLLDIQPSWLDIDDDQGIFDKILKEMPKDVSKTQQIKWGKAKIKELFRYDKTYPRWVQSPEWPIVNGKPLVFSHQSKEKKDDERVYYYFYDPETKEQVVIEQFY